MAAETTGRKYPFRGDALPGADEEQTGSPEGLPVVAVKEVGETLAMRPSRIMAVLRPLLQGAEVPTLEALVGLCAAFLGGHRFRRWAPWRESGGGCHWWALGSSQSPDAVDLQRRVNLIQEHAEKTTCGQIEGGDAAVATVPDEEGAAEIRRRRRAPSPGPTGN